MEKPKENIRTEPTILELKGRAYDLLAMRQRLEAEINGVNQQIAALSQPKPVEKK